MLMYFVSCAGFRHPSPTTVSRTIRVLHHLMAITVKTTNRDKFEVTTETVAYLAGKRRSIHKFSFFQSLDQLGHWGCEGGSVRDDSAEIFFRSFLQEALVSGSGMDRVVHSLLLFTQHFLCRPFTNQS